MTLGGIATFFVVLTASCSSPTEASLADLDKDGKLTTEEVEDHLVEVIFKKEDLNKDGRVTTNEWTKVNPDSPVSLFKKRDTNRDGVVEMGEFHRYVDSSKLMDEFLDELDRDDDNLLSPTEIKAAEAAATR